VGIPLELILFSSPTFNHTPGNLPLKNFLANRQKTG
jgi:hypothetical protein